jgi:hypothetical protein
MMSQQFKQHGEEKT